MTYFLPGMGADGSMYSGAWRTLADAVFVDWPRYQGETRIGDVAQKIVEERGIKDGDTVVGASLGGMVACEVAGIVKLQNLILIGGVCHPDEINGLLKLFHPLARLAPLEFIQGLSGKVPGELARMFVGVNAEFVRAMCFAVFEWEGLRKGLIAPIRIHGEADLVVPLPERVDKILEGGHLISMTHARECVDWLIERKLAERNTTD